MRLAYIWKDAGRPGLAWAHAQAIAGIRRPTDLAATPLRLEDVQKLIDSNYDGESFARVVNAGAIGFLIDSDTLAAFRKRKWRLSEIRAVSERTMADMIQGSEALANAVEVKFVTKMRIKTESCSAVVRLRNTSPVPLSGVEVTCNYRDKDSKALFTSIVPPRLYSRLEPGKEQLVNVYFSGRADLKKRGVNLDDVRTWGLTPRRARNASALTALRLASQPLSGGGLAFTITNATPGLTFETVTLAATVTGASRKRFTFADGDHVYSVRTTTVNLAPGQTSGKVVFDDWNRASFWHSLGMPKSTGRYYVSAMVIDAKIRAR
jgi:hypothetical protein